LLTPPRAGNATDHVLREPGFETARFEVTAIEIDYYGVSNASDGTERYARRTIPLGPRHRA
jgi:hypothetical protein